MWFVVSAVWGLWSAQGALVLESTLLLCWPIPRVVTGGCASITACDSVDMIGNLLVPLKLLSVRVLFFELAGTDCQASCCLSPHVEGKLSPP